MSKLIKKFWNDEQGLELSEYAIMAGVIIVIVIAVITGMGGHINSIFTKVNNTLSAADSAS
jgi:pilus assembly protein Flp/PilA